MQCASWAACVAVALVVVFVPMTTTGAQSPAPRRADVWVNSDTKVYHCPDTRWYGKTKVGKYMTEAEARKAGRKPAGGKECPAPQRPTAR